MISFIFLVLSVCVLCGSPVWPSSPVVGPLWGPPLCVGPLFGSPVWVPCVGPLCGSPVWVPCVGPSARRVASCGIYSRDVSRSFTRSRLVFTNSHGPHRRQGLASDSVRYTGARRSVGRRFRSVTKLTTKVRIGRVYLWGSFLIAAAALKTPTRNGYNAQGVNLKFRRAEYPKW